MKLAFTRFNLHRQSQVALFNASQLQFQMRMFARNNKVTSFSKASQKLDSLQDSGKVSDKVDHPDQQVEKQKPKLNKVQSIIDKINAIQLNENGTVEHKVFADPNSNTGKMRTFKSMDVFKRWRDRHLAGMKAQMKKKLSPHEYYITQEGGYERPFTGEYWNTMDVGMYECKCCSQKIFMYEHKFKDKSGYPTFWNSLRDSIKFKSDGSYTARYTNAHEDPLLKFKRPLKRVVCSNCESHLGHVFDDGPPPLGLRYMINSASLNFVEKPWFKVPETTPMDRKVDEKKVIASKAGHEAYNELIEDEQLLGIDRFENRVNKKELHRQLLRDRSAPKVRRTSAPKVEFDIKGELKQ